MDYTKIPRYLIYKDRRDIDEFPVRSRFDYQFMEEVYLEALEQRPFIKDAYEAPELILSIFNNARYITTLICMESHPNHYFRKYLEKAGSNDRNIVIANHAMPATMALVKNYLCHYMPNFYDGSKIVEDISNNFNSKAWKEYTHGGQEDFNKLAIEHIVEHPGWLSDPNFEPRDIREVVDDIFLTAQDISENIDYIMESLKRNVGITDEEIAPLNALYKKVEAWFPSDLDDNMHKELALSMIDNRLKKLDPNNAYEFFNLMNEMDKSLYTGQEVTPNTKKNIKDYMKKNLGVDIDEIESDLSANQVNDEIEEKKKRIADLEADNKRLKEQLDEKNNEVDDCNKEILRLTGEVNRLTQQIEELRQRNADGSEGRGTEWISCFDGFLHSSLNPQAIALALDKVTHPYFSKNERGYWWVFVTVLTEIHWIPKPNYKLALQWANLHFKCGWNWQKDNQFKFSDINENIKSVHPSSKWNKSVTGNVIGDYYGELAKTMKDTFVNVVNGGKLLDKNKFINPGSPFINNGKK